MAKTRWARIWRGFLNACCLLSSIPTIFTLYFPAFHRAIYPCRTGWSLRDPMGPSAARKSNRKKPAYRSNR